MSGAPGAPAGGEITLEQALERLEEIARRLEGDDLELTESLALYEEGVRLLRLTDGILGAAEDRVEQLRADSGSAAPEAEDPT